MKTVVLSGYYGYENMGDEALLAAIVGALKAEVADLHIIVLSAAPEKTSARYGVEAASRLNLFSVASALKRADLLISGGGSLLQDVTGPLTIPYYLGIVALAKALGKPVMFYAQGIGPVNGSLGKTLIRLIADRVDMITLRDKASAELLHEIGVCKPPLEVTADPVFGVDLTDCGGAEGILNELGFTLPEEPVAGIFVREWKGMLGYKKAVAGLADSLLDKNRQVIFVPMQYPADVVPAGEIAGMMKNKPLLIEKGLKLSQITGLVNSMDIVIGMRLHALIIAAVCAVPMVGISYDPKVEDFLHTIDQPVVRELESVTAGQLTDRVETVMANREDICRRLVDQKNSLRQKARRNTQLAIQLLRGNKQKKC